MEITLPLLVRQALERLIRAFDPEQVLLFGSVAKGTNDDNSDVDLLIVTRTVDDVSLLRRRARQLTAGCFPAVDIVFVSSDELANAEILKSPFLASITEKGLVVYLKVQSEAVRPNN
ncbi:MAG TPA: nucleotidyltransferase domain-containing protein [Puia sp.]|nr:nucleotidyltransferase domain-containing protein [Puia sp.]